MTKIRDIVRTWKIEHSKNVNYAYLKHCLGSQINIRNGHGYGFISDTFLYNNQYLELGFGKVRSGYGDWGGGATHAVTSPLKVTIDQNFNIVKKEVDSFYNSKDSQKAEEEALKILNRMGDKLKLEDEFLEGILKRLFKAHHCKSTIGFGGYVDTEDLEKMERMTKYTEDSFKEQN